MDTEEWTDQAIVDMLRRWRPVDRAQAGRVLNGWVHAHTLTAERKAAILGHFRQSRQIATNR